MAKRGRSAQDVAEWLVRTTGNRARTLGEHVFAYQQEDALRHVFRVAASLDSMIVGEPQIVGQMRDAYKLATTAEARPRDVSRGAAANGPSNATCSSQC